MASSVDDDAEVRFEEGMLWLPSHVLHHPCDSKVYTRDNHQKQQQQEEGHHRLPREPQSQNSKCCSRSSYSYERPKGGPGMQAVFLVSGQGSCGTGVFLPQKAGTKSTRKPACAPVLLPARVVQALNLKVHQLGLQISPPQVPKHNPRRGEVYSSELSKKKTDEKDALQQCCAAISQSQNSNPEIFLPKEWTY
ncbi:hypothetical protein RJT34_20136 [Clitoria ternatea]|uniref:Uncharacterized protein n=1 Tax=Clitoria ternatea TaxID=43366 RepID=A0AAN9ISD1_CLITE